MFDEAELEEVYRRRYRAYCRLAEGYLHSCDEAEDAVQEGFLRAWRFRAQHRGDCQLYSWVWRVIINECLDRLRKRRAVPPMPISEMVREPRTEDATFEQILRAEQTMLVICTLHRLGRPERACVRSVLSGHPIRTNTDKVRRHRAVIRLRQILRTAA